jgi:hypothetical protein
MLTRTAALKMNAGTRIHFRPEPIRAMLASFFAVRVGRSLKTAVVAYRRLIWYARLRTELSYRCDEGSPDFAGVKP